MKKTIIIILSVVFFACTETVVQPPDIYNVYTQDGIGRYEVGHVELKFDLTAQSGKTITVDNGNDRAIGITIVDNKNQSIIVLSDSWIGGLAQTTHEAVFYQAEELLVKIIVYKSVSGTIQAFIEALGTGFFDKLDSVWIEAEYEQVIILH